MTERLRILLAGVGGGGGNTLARLLRLWNDAPEMVAIDTDLQKLSSLPVPNRLELGSAESRGFSAGGDPEAGSRAAELSVEALRELFQGVDLAVLMGGLGGGTATGALPVISRVARECGALTLGFCTLPFFFEGPAKRRLAAEGLRHLRADAHAVIALPNERLLDRLAPQTELTRAFLLADEAVCAGIRSLWMLLTRPGLIHLDFSHLQALVKAGGTLALAGGEGEGPDRGRQALEGLALSPLLEHGAVLKQAQSVLVGVTGGPDLTLVELQQVMEGVTNQLGPQTELHMGTAIDPDLRGRLLLTVLATEAQAPEPAVEPAASPAPPEAPGETEPAETAAKDAKRGKAKTARSKGPVQTNLRFDTQGRGRFSNTSPTIHEGEDLDVPTYLRRNVRLMTPVSG